MGIVRLFLALIVIAHHTGIGKSLHVDGREAVTLFYLISGFYMAMILNTKYVGHGSILRFYKSRYLRLWVPYVAVTGFYLIGLYSSLIKLPVQFPVVNHLDPISLFPLMADCLSIFFIFGQDLYYLFSTASNGQLIYLPYGETGFNGSRFILNPVIFSISLELYFYILAPFVLRSFNKTIVFMAAGFLWHLYFNLEGNTGLGVQYHLFPATLLFFGLGATSYWMMVAKDKFDNKAGYLVAFMIVAMLPWMKFAAYGLLVALFFFLVPAIFSLSKSSRIDRLIGELSYPVYVVHFPVILVVKQHFKPQASTGVFFYTVVLSIILAYVLYLVIEKPLSKYREQFAHG